MIDLHIHSYFSNDGEFSPKELVRQCSGQGTAFMALADHNTVHGCLEAVAAAKDAGITCIPAIEIDCVYEGLGFHVLGYAIDVSSCDFAEIEQDIRNQGEAASMEMLEKTQALGFDITGEDLTRLCKDSFWPESWTGEQFAEVLLSDLRYTSSPLLLPYRTGGARSDNPLVNIYWDLYSQGKPCHAKMTYPAMETIVEIIHRNGGAAVLAHPGMNLKGNLKLLDGIAKMGMDGMEVFSSYHSPEQIQTLKEEADRLHLFMTCGSDFHGKTKPAIALGQHGCFLTEDEMKRQMEPLLKKI